MSNIIDVHEIKEDKYNLLVNMLYNVRHDLSLYIYLNGFDLSSSQSIYLKKIKDTIKNIIRYTDYNINICKCNVYSEKNCIEQIKNNMDNSTGILLLQPFPKHWNMHNILNCIPKEKDVEGISPEHTLDLYMNNVTDMIYPCTAKSVMDVIHDIKNKNINMGNNVTIIGRSHIVGKPLIYMLINDNYTVSICHSHTDKKIMMDMIKNADIVITCLDKPEILGNNENEFKDGSYIIDVGTCINNEGKLVGNINKKIYTNSNVNINITTVPNGIGILTPFVLLENLLHCYYNYQ